MKDAKIDALHRSAFLGVADDWPPPATMPEVAVDAGVPLTSGADAPPGTRAVLYLRVSTPGQVQTDFDPEGISIPAQRDACIRKAEQLGLNIIGEYVEPGRSATEMAKRVSFQQMLERIRRERDVDYLIIYKLSRMNRNRLDDAIVMADLRKRGVSLVSATESIDDTPVGQLMHGILAAFNEYRSREDGADIAYKMGQKAKKGGTLGQATIGYLNATLAMDDGRKIRTVEVDPERGPLVQTAFKLYATGDYSLLDIERIVKERGLLTRRTPKRAAKPVTRKEWARIFRKRYYLGIVTYKDEEEVPGRHEPLIDDETFERVQRVLDEHGVAGERRRIHHSYIKGSLFCGNCRRNGAIRRMLLHKTTNRHGIEYTYVFCSGTRGGGCQSSFCNLDRIEDLVVEHYKTIAFTPEFIELMRSAMEHTRTESQATQRLYRKNLQDQLKDLDTKETNLVELAEDGALPAGRVRTRITEIQRERNKLQAALGQVIDSLDAGAEYINACLELLRNPYEMYKRASDKVRRRLNQAIFKRILVFNEEITGHELQPALAELHAIQAGVAAVQRGEEPATAALIARSVLKRHMPETEIATRMGGESLKLAEALTCGFSSRQGFDKALLVELRGLEPLTPTLPVWCATSCAIAPSGVPPVFPGCLNEVTPRGDREPNRLDTGVERLVRGPGRRPSSGFRRRSWWCRRRPRGWRRGRRGGW